jgi:HEAT repeat protein
MKQIVVATILMLMLIGSVHGDEVDDLILDLKYGQDQARINAALTLGNTRDLRAVDPLIAVLKDRNWEVRDNAASSLGMIGDVRAVDPLLGTLKDDDVGVVRAHSALALGDIGDPRAINKLTEEVGGDYRIRMCASSSLVRLGKPEYFDQITQFLTDDDADVRTWAALALGYTGDIRAIEPLTYLVQNDDNSAVVSTASEALDRISRSSMPINATIPVNASEPSTDLFGVTANAYSETADLNQAVESEFGNEYRVADWNDIKAYSGDIKGWADRIGMKNKDYYFVTWNGKGFWNDGNRHYFITRFDGVVDSNYAVHDQIDNNTITLGSWYDIEERILAIRKA